VRSTLYNEHDTRKEIALYSLTKNLFTRSLRENLFDKYGIPQTNEQTEIKLKNLMDALCSPLESAKEIIDPVQMKLIKSRLIVIIIQAIKALPKETSGTATDDALRSNTVEHIQEAYKENENQQEEETLTQYEEQFDVGNHEPEDEKSWEKLDLQWI